MRDSLPMRPKVCECGIINLDSKNGPGTHWVAYKKRLNKAVYFDSYGNLRPPAELISYLRGSDIKYNHNRVQNFNSINCGHLCLKFLFNKSNCFDNPVSICH